NRTLGATIGEALFVGYTNGISYGLMGDPTLRMHTVQPPTGLSATKGDGTVTLNWTASLDAAVSGYNIYTAPTRKGPYTLVNTGGAVTGHSYVATRPGSGSPDNFYMVRAVKTEVTPIGSYTNMSEGAIVILPGALTPYLSIVSQPINRKVQAHTADGIANS